MPDIVLKILACLHLIGTSQQACEVGTMCILILQRRKQRTED